MFYTRQAVWTQQWPAVLSRQSWSIKCIIWLLLLADMKIMPNIISFIIYFRFWYEMWPVLMRFTQNDGSKTKTDCLLTAFFHNHWSKFSVTSIFRIYAAFMKLGNVGSLVGLCIPHAFLTWTIITDTEQSYPVTAVLSEGNSALRWMESWKTPSIHCPSSAHSHTVTLGSLSVMVVLYFMSITITQRDTGGIFYY